MQWLSPHCVALHYTNCDCILPFDAILFIRPSLSRPRGEPFIYPPTEARLVPESFYGSLFFFRNCRFRKPLFGLTPSIQWKGAFILVFHFHVLYKSRHFQPFNSEWLLWALNMNRLQTFKQRSVLCLLKENSSPTLIISENCEKMSTKIIFLFAWYIFCINLDRNNKNSKNPLLRWLVTLNYQMVFFYLVCSTCTLLHGT